MQCESVASPYKKLPRKTLLQLEQVKAGEGVTSGRYILSPGFMQVSQTVLLDSMRALASVLALDESTSDTVQLAEAMSRQTYMAYLRKPKDAKEYLDRVVRASGHRSVTSGACVTSLFSGISLEAAVELIQYGGKIARLTSSKTNAMDNPPFRLLSSPDAHRDFEQRAHELFLSLKAQLESNYKPKSLSDNGREFFNMFSPTTKTIALFHTNNLKGWHSILKRAGAASSSTLTGIDTYTRCGGLSAELEAVLVKAAHSLWTKYPEIIEEPSVYFPHLKTKSERENQSTTEEETRVRTSALAGKRVPRKTFLERVASLGGETKDGLFVCTPGCIITAPPQPILEHLQERREDPEIQSFLWTQSIRFALCGIAFETVMELVAHDEATVTPALPLSNSETKVMTEEPCYRLQGTPEERVWQEDATRKFMKLKAELASATTFSFSHTAAEKNTRAEQQEEEEEEEEEEEKKNIWKQCFLDRFELGTRAVQLEYTMTLRDFDKLFIGRLSPFGNEQEIQEVCKMMCIRLNQMFPEHIATPEEYYTKENEQKYALANSGL